MANADKAKCILVNANEIADYFPNQSTVGLKQMWPLNAKQSSSECLNICVHKDILSAQPEFFYEFHERWVNFIGPTPNYVVSNSPQHLTRMALRKIAPFLEFNDAIAVLNMSFASLCGLVVSLSDNAELFKMYIIHVAVKFIHCS